MTLEALSKRYGQRTAVAEVSLDVADGEFVTLLGPSGSGKTTTLSLVAGFVSPDAGEIRIGGKPVTGIPAHRRELGVVFQSYALFPHLSAFDNIAYPLRVRRQGAQAVEARVREVLDLVELGAVAGSRPSQLSGGQQQRVAFARAIVYRPQVLLMDEPLSALDRKLREQLQEVLRDISRSLRITVLYVTHDQEEALALSDRIAIYEQGRIAQCGTGDELYQRPRSLFVARFMGESSILQGRLQGGGGTWTLATPHGDVPVAADRLPFRPAAGAAAALVIRPETVALAPAGSTGPRLAAVVRDQVFLGPIRRVRFTLGDGTLVTARLPATAGAALAPGDAVELAWDGDAQIVVPGPGTEGKD